MNYKISEDIFARLVVFTIYVVGINVQKFGEERPIDAIDLALTFVDKTIQVTEFYNSLMKVEI